MVRKGGRGGRERGRWSRRGRQTKDGGRDGHTFIHLQSCFLCALISGRKKLIIFVYEIRDKLTLMRNYNQTLSKLFSQSCREGGAGGREGGQGGREGGREGQGGREAGRETGREGRGQGGKGGRAGDREGRRQGGMEAGWEGGSSAQYQHIT